MSRTLAALLAAASLAQAQPAEPPVVVGATVPQSGLLAEPASDYAKALRLWEEEVNAAGGLLGRRVALVLLDDRSETHAVPGLYRTLLAEHRAELLLGPFGTAATLGAAGVAERARRVLVNATGAARAAQRAGYRYVFQVPAPLAEYARGALEIARRAGMSRLLVLARNDAPSRESASRVREQALKAGLRTGELEVYTPGTDDFAPQVDRARRERVDAWIAFGRARDAADMVKSFRRLAYAPPMFLAQGAADPAFIEMVGQDAELVMGISPYDTRAATPGNAQFAAAYAKRWGASPGHVAAQGYAAAKILEEAVKRAGSLAQDKLREALAALELSTPLGPYRVDAGGAQVAATSLVLQVQKGRREIVWPEALATARWQLPYPAWEGRKLLE